MNGSVKKLLASLLLAASVVAFPLNAKDKDIVDVKCVNPIFGSELFSVRGVYVKREQNVLELRSPTENSVMWYVMPEGIACIRARQQLEPQGEYNNNDGQ